MLSRILVAGDKGLLTDASRILLEAKGYQINICPQYSQAVGIILEDPPDIILVKQNYCDNKDIALIKAVKACLQKTNIPVILLVPEGNAPNLDWNLYQADDIMMQPLSGDLLLARLELAEARMMRVFDNNPLSRLPGNTSIIRAINRTLEKAEDYAVCYVDIDNFKPYNDRYGFTQGDDVILMVARIIVNVLEEKARTDSFIGHIGGDDFVFIIKTTNIEDVCKKILHNFEVVKAMFINKEDLKAGGYKERDRLGRETHYGLLSLSIAVITTENNKYKHYGEVSASASQMKHHVKQMDGSNYLIDRRSKYN